MMGIMHDVYEPLDPPLPCLIQSKPVTASDYLIYKVGRKDCGIVETNWPDEARSAAGSNTDGWSSGGDFLAASMKHAALFLPHSFRFAIGVGNILTQFGALGRDKQSPAFENVPKLSDSVIRINP